MTHFRYEFFKNGIQCVGPSRLMFLDSHRLFLYFSSSLYGEIWASSHVLTDHLEVVDYAEREPVSICS